MRDVTLYALLSLDGVAEEPGDWMFEADETVFRNLADVIGVQDDVVLGRGTYDYWADYWPTSDVQPFADFINTTIKHVVTSHPLDKGWEQSVVVDSPLPSYVRRLKAGSGGDIGVHGSIAVAQTLLAEDLVDRLELVVVPTLAGSGRRLFEDGSDPLRLTLARAESSPTGCVFLSYRRPSSD
ncbi:dihydrofolate reductase family protein [Nocardioides sp. zg-1228]|uniref:dihydrofolate reductase family protein n=1 Tax=Nocardioides sp. zg-1228 TaxID=2763008 RepID=UPI0016424247|nr:dihydrofolate reductase family protein [Nocardioides sp. zg-1228]MBC2934288.1 dihydrofolate reductase [Nocardioides sp. zg-1228]QSF59067.1 dihydrofolate reductase [Nocardioides sp. zg-1228]